MADTTGILMHEIEKIHSDVYKEYLHFLKEDFNVCIREKITKPFDRLEVPFCFKITQLVERLDKKEELLSDKFKNIFAAFNNTGATIALFAVKKNKIFDFYFFIKSKEIRFSEDDKNLLRDMLLSNFNGTKILELEPYKSYYKYVPIKDGKAQEDNVLDIEKVLNISKGSVACVSAVASEKSDKFISQGLEKLFDTPSEENFEILILANSLTANEISLARTGYENLATEIAPFSVRQESKGKSFADSLATTETNSKSHSHGTNESISNSIGGSVTVGGSIKVVNASATVSYNHTKTKGFSDTDTTSESKGTTKSTINTVTENSTLTYTDFIIKDSLEKIQEQIKRLDIGKSLGLWKTATYIHSESGATTKNIANIYKGLIQGEKSFIEPCVVTEWNDTESETYKNIIQYLQNFEHPVFAHIDDFNSAQKSNNNEVALVTPAVFVNTSELAQQMCFPRKSISGLPVLKCAEFAREIIYSDDSRKSNNNIDIGCIYHMRNAEEKLPVSLNIQNLASHTFITGSTGSGKSYTVYKLLSELKEKGLKFLVIEPAKGEYKNEFGKYVDMVYGTNPKLTSLLRINPFSFSGDTHILEHLDRLIEIFNVCWPMYAAMPAVLKEAVEKSYEDCGWDLTNSKNKYDDTLFPSFMDVTRNIKTIIDSSDYDAENKGAYKGSLITRLSSLTNGINGQIFTDDELSSEQLFENNVIVDLSRVGSSETKSLIMGLLVLKLQEYRMNQGASKLKHITVLEEAHNLLKRTSTEQSSESANLIGKSVEMLTNSIAEMRAFGEGFIIADQAPGLLDMAVIRNTNTKIILRLPDQSDRELVGKSANLNDEQIMELAKLPCGVAAIYQNEWIEPVLCKVDKFEDISIFSKEVHNISKIKQSLTSEQKLEIANFLYSGTPIPKFIIKDLSNYDISARSKAIILDAKDKAEKGIYEKADCNIGIVFAELYRNITNSLLEISRKTSEPDELLVAYNPMLANEIQDEDMRQKVFSTLIVDLFINKLHNSQLLEDWTNKYRER